MDYKKFLPGFTYQQRVLTLPANTWTQVIFANPNRVGMTIDDVKPIVGTNALYTLDPDQLLPNNGGFFFNVVNAFGSEGVTPFGSLVYPAVNLWASPAAAGLTSRILIVEFFIEDWPCKSRDLRAQSPYPPPSTSPAILTPIGDELPFEIPIITDLGGFNGSG